MPSLLPHLSPQHHPSGSEHVVVVVGRYSGLEPMYTQLKEMNDDDDATAEPKERRNLIPLNWEMICFCLLDQLAAGTTVYDVRGGCGNRTSKQMH